MASTLHKAIVALAAMMFMALAAASVQPLQAQTHRSVVRIQPAAQYPVTKRLIVGLDKSVIVELPREVSDVHVSNPKKLDAVLQSGQRVYLIGVAIGQANVFAFDTAGRQIATLEVSIERDLGAMSDMLHRLLPGSEIKLEAVNDNIVLTGRVRNAEDASRAADIVGRLLQSSDGSSSSSGTNTTSKVINMIAVEAKEQVLLKVAVVEMQRDMIKQLGINLDAVGNFGDVIANPLLPGTTIARKALGLVTDNGYTINNVVPPNAFSAQFSSGKGAIAGTLRALERSGLARTLAEPNLTAISGETANFLAGGEFPIPISEENNQITVEFKPFGIGLAFTPVVMTEGRISMKVSTEVSELSNEGAVTLNFITIPALKVRRANTTIELPSGGSLVMAGLISETTRQAIEGLPGLKNLPVLGTLFRSRDFVKNETELVVIVTPYVVDPVARAKLARPDDGFVPASDIKSDLMGHLNRIYGKQPDHMPVGGYKGDFGFIVE